MLYVLVLADLAILLALLTSICRNPNGSFELRACRKLPNLKRKAWSVLLLALGCRSSDTAMERGDRFWADRNTAPRWLSIGWRAAGSAGSADCGRVAHAYATVGQLERAKEQYTPAEAGAAILDQAVFDYLALARSAAGRSDRFGMSRAIEDAWSCVRVSTSGRGRQPWRDTTRERDADRALEYFERAGGGQG